MKEYRYFSDQSSILTKNRRKPKAYEITGAKIETDAEGNITQNGFDQAVLLMQLYCDNEYESARYLFVTKEGNIICHLAFSNGIPNSTLPYPDENEINEIRNYALENDCQIIFFHNHPNGFVEPSPADISLTEKLSEILIDNSMKKRLAAHIILDTGSDTYGFWNKDSHDWNIHYKGMFHSINEYNSDVESRRLIINHNLEPDRKLIYLPVGDEKTPQYLSQMERVYNSDGEWDKKDWIPAFFLKEYGIVEHIEYIHKSLLNDYKAFDSKLQDIGTKTGSTRCYLLPSDYEIAVECMKYAEKKFSYKGKVYENGTIEAVYCSDENVPSQLRCRVYGRSIFDNLGSRNVKIRDDSRNYPLGYSMKNIDISETESSKEINNMSEIKSVLPEEIVKYVNENSLWAITEAQAKQYIESFKRAGLEITVDLENKRLGVSGNTAGTIFEDFGEKNLDIPDIQLFIEKEDERTRTDIAQQIRENMPNLSDEERASALSILEAGAKSMGLSISEYVAQTFPEGIFGNIAEAQKAAWKQGKEMNGAVVVDGFGENARAVIYASRTADFSTWVHEIAHIWQAQLTGNLKRRAEEAFQVQDGDWKKSIYTFADGHTDSSGEAFAYGFEDCLKNAEGEFSAPDKKRIYEKFAQFMSRTYNGLGKNIEISDEIRKVYDAFLLVDDNILAKAEKAVRMEKEFSANRLNTIEHRHAEESAFQFQIVGENSIRAMSKSLERNRILSNLTAAVILDESITNVTGEAKAARIRIETGWEKDASGQWKYETDDSISRIKNGSAFEKILNTNPKALTSLTANGKTMKLSDLLDAQELFSIFPFMKDVNVRFYDDPDTYRALLDSDGIMINTHYLNTTNGEKGLKGVLSHEIQHIIQAIEYTGKNDLRGENLEELYFEAMKAMREANTRIYDYDTNSVDAGIEKYMKEAGEIEARNVARRIAFSDSERRHKTLQSTEDISRKFQFQEIKHKESIMNAFEYQNKLSEDERNILKLNLIGNSYARHTDLERFGHPYEIGKGKDMLINFTTCDGKNMELKTKDDVTSYVIEMQSKINSMKNYISKDELKDIKDDLKKINTHLKQFPNNEEASYKLSSRLSSLENKVRFYQENHRGADGNFDANVINYPGGYEKTIEVFNAAIEHHSEIIRDADLSDAIKKALGINNEHDISLFDAAFEKERLRQREYNEDISADKILEAFFAAKLGIPNRYEISKMGIPDDKYNNIYSRINSIAHLSAMNPGDSDFNKSDSIYRFKDYRTVVAKLLSDSSIHNIEINSFSEGLDFVSEVLSDDIKKDMWKDAGIEPPSIENEVEQDQQVQFQEITNEQGIQTDVHELKGDDLKKDFMSVLAADFYLKPEEQSFAEMFSEKLMSRYSPAQLGEINSIVLNMTGANSKSEVFSSLEKQVLELQKNTEQAVSEDLSTKDFKALSEKYINSSPVEKEAFRKVFDETIQVKLGNDLSKESPDTTELSKIVQTRFITADISDRIINGKALEGRDGEKLISLNSIDDVIKYIQSDPQRFERSEWVYGKDTDKIRQADKERSVEKQKTNYVLDKLAAAGIEVVTDKAEFNNILEEEDILQKMSASEQESKLSIDVRDIITDSLQKSAEPFVPTVFSRENYQKIFKDGIIETPVETVKIGPNQFIKLCPANRNNLMLAVRRTLESPSLVLEKETFDEKTETFKPVHVYGKSFINTINNHTKTVESVIVFKEGENIAMSFHNKDISKFVNQIKTADDIIYIDEEASRVIAFDTKDGGNHVVKEIQDILSSSEQKFLPLNKRYNRNSVLSTEDFIIKNQIQIGNLEITQDNFDKYFNIFNRHDSYKDNPDKIASELFNYHVSENNKEAMRKWLTEEGYTIKEKTKSQKMVLNDGIVYGYAFDNKIYLNPDIMNSEVAVHEYTHLWDNYTQRTNPELWEKGKSIFKNTKFWEEVKADPNYADIAYNDDLLLSEVHSRICGKMADKILSKITEQNGELTKDTVINWDKETWEYICEELIANKSFNLENGLSSKDLSEFLAMPVKDLMQGRNISVERSEGLSQDNQGNIASISDVEQNLSDNKNPETEKEKLWPGFNENGEVQFYNHDEYVEAFGEEPEEKNALPENSVNISNAEQNLSDDKNTPIAEKEVNSDELKFTKTPIDKSQVTTEIPTVNLNPESIASKHQEENHSGNNINSKDFLLGALKCNSPEEYEEYYKNNYHFNGKAAFKPCLPIADNKMVLYINGKETKKVFDNTKEQLASMTRWCVEQGFDFLIPTPEDVKKYGRDAIVKNVEIFNKLLGTDITQEQSNSLTPDTKQQTDINKGQGNLTPMLYANGTLTEQEMELFQHLEIDKISEFIKDPYQHDVAVPKFGYEKVNPQTGKTELIEQTGWHFAQKEIQAGTVSSIILTKMNENGQREFLKLDPTTYEAMVNRGSELMKTWNQPLSKEAHLASVYSYEDSLKIERYSRRSNTCCNYLHNFMAMCRGEDGGTPANNIKEAMAVAAKIYYQMSPHEKERLKKMEKEWNESHDNTFQEELERRFKEIIKERVYSHDDLAYAGHDNKGYVNKAGLEANSGNKLLEEKTGKKIGDSVKLSINFKNTKGDVFQLDTAEYKIAGASREQNCICVINSQTNEKWEMPLDKFIERQQQINKKQEKIQQHHVKTEKKIETQQKQKENDLYSMGL